MKTEFSLGENELIQTFGGESFIDDYKWAEYGIRFGSVAVHEITPDQMIKFAQTIVDHLILNGHVFEIENTGEQDQRKRLVCKDKTT